MNDLLAEKERLTARLKWLGLRSTGSERIERRIKEIDRLVERHNATIRPP